MFEKEAKKWVMNNSKNIINKVSNGETNLFGIAEQAYQQGANFGYNKANEWHKVSNGDIPENERWVCNQDGCYCYYDIDTEQWLDTEGTRTRTIEWCDMPTKEIE